MSAGNAGTGGLPNPGPSRVFRFLLIAGQVTLALAALAVPLWFMVPAKTTPDTVHLVSDLPRQGVVAADVGAPQVGGTWLVTSGTLLARDGQLWSGVPDAGPPDPQLGRTGSAVLRAVSVDSHFRDVKVHLRVRTTKLSRTRRTPPHAWDGVHLFLRYHDQNNLYAVDLLRRDGTLTVKRKTGPRRSGSLDDAGSTEGTYTTLGKAQLSLDRRWHRYDVSVADRGRGVRISLRVDRRSILTVFDRSRSAIRDAGRVGLRGDNADFVVRVFDVQPTK